MALTPLQQTVLGTIRRHRMLEGCRRLGVAVSGGADSVCLLHLLRIHAGCELELLHCDHGLRGAESDADREFVRELAAGLGIPFHCLRLQLAPGNLEQEARRARREAFRSWRAELRLDAIALGHTRSDQAETVVFRLLRGSGSSGLAGIPPVTPDRLIRPLLDVERVEIVEWLASRGYRWREDSSNHSLDYDRNRIRHILLPELQREWNPNIVASLAHTADIAAAEEAFWSAAIDAAGLRARPDGSVVCAVGDLRSSHLALARRLVRRAIELAAGSLRQIDFVHVERVLTLAADPPPGLRVQIPGLDVRRSFDWLRFARPELSRPAGFEIEIRGPGRYPFPGGTHVELEVLESKGEASGCDTVRVDVDVRLHPGAFRLRSWRPGDRYQPCGHSQPSKVKHLFQSARIPVWDRWDWPIVELGGVVLWARRFGVEARDRGGDSGYRLRIRELPLE